MADVRQIKLVIVSLLALGVILELLDALVFAIVFTYLTRPVFNGLFRVIKNRTASAAITALFVLGLIVYPIVYAVRELAGNLDSLKIFAENSIDGLLAYMSSAGISVGDNLTQMAMEKLIVWLSGFILATPGLLLELFIMLAMIFYFHRDGPQIKEYIMSLAQDAKQKDILGSIEMLLNAVIVGNFATAIVVGVFSWVAFTVAGVEYALPIAVLAGLGALLPIVGSWMAYAPLVVYEYLVGEYFLMGIVLGIAVVAELLEIYLPPKISSYRSKVHPGILLLGFIGGPLFLGIKGIVLGPLILGSLKIILDQYRNEVEKKR